MNRMMYLMITGLMLLSVGLFQCSQARAMGLCSSSFISSDGYILTAAHCYNNDLKVIYTNANGVGTSSAIPIVVKVDKTKDLMLLKIFVSNQPYLKISKSVAFGTPVHLMGWPDPDSFGYKLKDYKGVLKDFIVISTESYTNQIRYWIAGPIAPGMSGGALTNSDYEIIGVISAGDDYTEGTLGKEGYTVTLGQLGQFLKDLNILLPQDNGSKDPHHAMAIILMGD